MKLNLDTVRFFQEQYVPPDCTLAGYAALAHALNVQAPVRNPACISRRRQKESTREVDGWRIFDSKYLIEASFAEHLTFAMRHEEVDLLVLKRIFTATDERWVESFVASAPTGPIARRVWFLYEFLTRKQLNLPDSGKVTMTDLLDPKRYFTGQPVLSSRHKVRNNLLGTADFCPIIRRTERLESFISQDVSKTTHTMLADVSPQLVARAASFLLLADSQASFAIEGERLPRNKEERWLRAVKQVGKYPLSVDELDRLHKILIEDWRFIQPGFRKAGVFLGRRTADRDPLPEFIGAKPEDVPTLIQHMIETNNILTRSPLDAVLQSAATAFGFVYIHPYEDGNGRVHRCLIHHILAEKRFSPPGLVFPVSSVMLKWIDRYKETLQAHSAPLMPFIEWTPDENQNVRVLNDTADLYRYFDCTAAAEFLYECVLETIEHDVPEELDYLKRHDKATHLLSRTVEMPNHLMEDFIMFMRQNSWKLPKRRRQNEFAQLTDSEVEKMESIVRNEFQAES